MKDEIFLCASVPVAGQGRHHETANPFLIQHAVRELVTLVIHSHRIVWSGHPAIAPMIRAICESLGESYTNSVVLTDAVQDDQKASLSLMRESMLAREGLVAAVFIGGAEDAEADLASFQRHHPSARIVPVAATGGAARDIALRMPHLPASTLEDIDFARLFRQEFGVEAPHTPS